MQDIENETAPFYISVGEGIMLQKTRIRHVLLRENTNWNHMEVTFNSTMKATHIPYEGLLDMTRKILGEEGMEKYLERNSFSMVWRNESRPDLGKIFTPPVDPAFVLGSLELVIPFVVVRGCKHCEEAMKLLEE